MNNNPNRYQELDALRGIAALMVVFFHLTMGRQEAQFGFKLGTTGVDLFFMISGFVIFMSLVKVKTSKDFIINRVSRLYPTYWACVSFTSILIVILSFHKQKGLSLINYLGNMTMFQYYLKIPDIDGPYWTMIIEMIFYIVMVLLFQFKVLKYIKPIGLTLSLIVVIFTAYFNGNLVFKIFSYIPLLKFIPLFFAGIIFYKIYTEKHNTVENYCILLLCLVCQISLYNYAGWSMRFISQIEYAGMLIIYFTLFTLFVNGRLKIIVSKASLFLGKISFALYLIHQKISIGYLIPTLVNKHHINYWIASLLIVLPILIGVAAIITYYIEVPLNKRMREKLRPSTATHAHSRMKDLSV